MYLVFLAVGVFFLIFAILTTGETRKEVCQMECCNVTGRIIEAICILVTWVLNLGFVIITGVTMIPLVLILVMKMTCETDFAEGRTDCVKLHPIGPMSSKNNTICGNKASEFCDKVGDINNLLITAFVASVIVCIGLVQFLIAMSANYVHVEDEVNGYEDLDKPKEPAPAPAPAPAP